MNIMRSTIKLEKAVFGQVNQGHGLCCYSSEKDFFNKASPYLDLPDVIPSGVDPYPYISGFPLDNYYIIARTFLDETASRSGMVIVYALAIPLEEIAYLDTINKIFELLPKAHCDKNEFINQTSVLDNLQDISTTNNYFSDQVAELLVDRRKGPIIHVGLSNFEELINCVWSKLWPTMRKNFIFRLSLRPGDCVEPALPSVVCIPEALIARWGTDCKKIDYTIANESISIAAEALYSSYTKYKDFIEKFGIELKSPQLLGVLVQANIKYLLKLPDFNACLQLVRFIEVLSPDNTIGCDSKKLLINQLVNLINETKIEEILKLRNFEGTSFNGFQIIWDTIVAKIKNYHFATVDDHFIVQIIKDTYDFEKVASDNWKKAVKSGLSLAFTNQESSIYSAIWRWFDLSPHLVLKVFSHINLTSVIENQLVAHVPLVISNDYEEILLPFLTEHNFLQLHGLIIGTRYSAVEALSKQLALDRDKCFIKGLESLLSRVNPSELLHACSTVNDDRVRDIVITKATKKPIILRQVSSSSSESLTIWAKVLLIDPNVWNAPQNPQEILLLLLDEYSRSRKSPHFKLIELLSNTPIADLCEFSNRQVLWDLFEKKVCDNFLQRTALGWYDRALMQNFIDLDPVLKKAVYDIPDLIKKLKQDSLDNTKGVLGIFSCIDFSQSEFIDWLLFWLDNHSQKTDADMKVVGQIISQRNWNNAATTVFNNAKSSNEDFSTILHPCQILLPIWDRLTFGNANENEKWEALAELLHSLYSKGPDDQDIWSRSGGSDWDLWSLSSGRSSWRKALKKIRKGSKPHPSKLIHEIKSDFPNNEKVSILMKLF